MAGQDDKAIEWFKVYLDQYPFSETGWYHLGAAYFRLDDWDKALDAMDYALIIDENFTAAHFDRGRILEEQESYAEALKAFEAAIDSDEPNGYTFYRMGVCYQALGNESEAIESLKLATKMDEDLDEAWIELAVLYGEAGRLFEGIQHAKKALSLDPDNPDYYLVAYDLYMQLGLLLEADKMLKMVLKSLRIEEPTGLLEYAKSLLEMNQIDAAHSVLRMGLERYPDSPEMLAIYSGFLYAIQEMTLAQNHLKEGLLRYGSSFSEHLYAHYPKLAEDPEVSGEITKHLPQA
jgi:tetratricopeptide (TPR) repeat protein